MIYTFQPIVRKSIHAQMKMAGFFKKYSTTLLPNKIYAHSRYYGVDIPNLVENLSNNEISKLPRYPDIAIHYRCSDNIMFSGMGLLSFHHIKKLIPLDAKYIFILTEDIDYNRHLCRPVLDALQSDIKAQFSQAHVIIRRGGYKVEVLAMLIHSRITICSLSTFCYFFATSNTNGQVFIPKSKWFGQVIEINNIHTLNVSAIYKWIRSNGTLVKDVNELTAEFMIETLRNESYVPE